MQYSLLAGGKRMRPVLVLAAADAIGLGHPDARALALPAACALEMIHTYSLVHDDLPAMDNDTLRRGRPTAHVVYGDAMAILSGDGLLTEAFALLAREPALDGPAIASRKLQTLELIARSAGACGMVGGQALDLQFEGAARQENADDDLRRLQDVHARKTGALIRAATGAGAIMAGGTPTQVAAVDAYATELGLCFQIIDDVLDVEGDAVSLGKSAGKDEAAGKLTYPALFGVAGSRQRARDCADRGHAALTAAGLSGHLPAILDWTLTRSQ
jgi:geranylgeranyl diphosphate synthase type II